MLRNDGWEGLSYADGVLWVTARDAGVVALDVTDPARPEELATGEGLSAPWELSDVHEGWIYAADNALGVVPVDVSDPGAPVVGTPIDVGGAVLHVAVADGWLYASAGGAGVAVLSLEEPARPELVTVLDAGGSSVMAAVDGGVLYVANHDGLAVFDVSDPRAPVPAGWQVTEQFALGVDAADGIAWIADWTALDAWRVDPAAGSGEADLSRDEVRLADGGGTAELTVTNRGGGTLRLLGATTGDDRVTVEVSAASLAPGEVARVRYTYAGGDALQATACLATDDPDDAQLDVALGSGATESYIGLPAPDFALPGLDGETYRLSEQLGHPVMLAYFATW